MNFRAATLKVPRIVREEVGGLKRLQRKRAKIGAKSSGGASARLNLLFGGKKESLLRKKIAAVTLLGSYSKSCVG